MDAEKLSHIFEPFFTTKEVGKGPGLGLSVVHGIVEEHKATIEVSSKLGRGTTVAVYFPTQAVQPTSNASEVPAILFVEDEEAVRRAVTGTLERGGFEVLEAANAHEAQQQWQQNSRRISLVIADVVLPQGLNGRTLAEQIQGTHPETIFLFISGYREEVAIPGLSAARRQYFLQKPFTPREVLETVQRLLAENIVAPLASLPS
jgi:CheY-like chemotaxis protein